MRSTATAVTIAVLLQGCATGGLLQHAGRSAKDGDVVGASLLLLVSPFAVLKDVITLGGLTESEPDSAATASSYVQEPTHAPADEVTAERDKTERDLGIARTGEQMLQAMGKDASGIRLQRQILEQSLARQNAQVEQISVAASTSTKNSSSSARDSSDSAGLSGCKTTLTHLAPRLPSYSVAELNNARNAILAEDLNRALKRARELGYTTGTAAKASLDAANNADREVEKAKVCIRTNNNNSENVISDLMAGQFDFGSRSLRELSLSHNCAAMFVLMQYTAIATRESAIQMTCLAQS